ncbi:unnamed protein product [Tilletia controversa]|nr:unnamed protein product [Tilletia controversa]
MPPVSVPTASTSPGALAALPGSSESPASALVQTTGPATLTAKAYGRGIKRTADGVIYTDANKMIAVHYAFYKPGGKKRRTVEEAEKNLKVARKTLYQWKKQFPLAAG